MLNLTNPIVFTVEEQAHIQAIMSERDGIGNLLSGPKLWAKNDDNTYRIKGRISTHTLTHQRCRCPYCESFLLQGEAQIEHFAPKGKHREFTFEPQNLTTACGRCNSKRIKGEKDTIVSPKNPAYIRNNFLIVHPYLCQNPDAEIVFEDESRTTFNKAACSQLGLETITFFHWDDADARIARLREAPLRNANLDIAQLVREISTYK